MNASLSILLPVHNAETSLAAAVGAVIEIASELTPRLEIAVIDDGSTDATEELACELAVRFPQVLVARHQRRRGIDESIHTGMAATSGAVVMVQPQDQPVQPAEMRQLWNLAVADDSVDASSEGASPRPSNVVLRLRKWGRHLKQVEAERREGLRMICRERYQRRRPARRFEPSRLDRQAPAAPATPNFLGHVKNFAFED